MSPKKIGSPLPSLGQWLSPCSGCVGKLEMGRAALWGWWSCGGVEEDKMGWGTEGWHCIRPLIAITMPKQSNPLAPAACSSELWFLCCIWDPGMGAVEKGLPDNAQLY